MSIKSVIKKIITVSKEREIIPIAHPIACNKMFDGKVALISGGYGGIGIAISNSLAESGCKVILVGTNDDKLKIYKNQLEQKYSNAIGTLNLNLTDINTFPEKLSKAVDIFGKIDIFINAAGVHTENVDLWNVTSEEYDRILSINLKGPYFFSLEIAKYMRKNNIRGHILYISSTRGSEPAWSPYGISKWGLNGITEGLAKMFLPYGIVVNAIAPGSTATELLGFKEGDSIYTAENSVGRYVMPDEVASYAKMLVSDVGNMVVGETIKVSGGRGNIDIR